MDIGTTFLPSYEKLYFAHGEIFITENNAIRPISTMNHNVIEEREGELGKFPHDASFYPYSQ